LEVCSTMEMASCPVPERSSTVEVTAPFLSFSSQTSSQRSSYVYQEGTSYLTKNMELSTGISDQNQPSDGKSSCLNHRPSAKRPRSHAFPPNVGRITNKRPDLAGLESLAFVKTCPSRVRIQQHNQLSIGVFHG
jgi:hypothetical protein